MSLLPMIYMDSFLNSMRPTRLCNQHFGLTLEPEDFISPLTNEINSMFRYPGYIRPWRTSAARTDSGSTVSLCKDKFQVNLDVQQFKPEEISVKVTGKNEITIEGKHEEQQDKHGYISRHFVRKYVVPEGHDMEKVVSQLSSDGVLSIVAPKVDQPTVGHREIHVQKINTPAAESQKEN